MKIHLREYADFGLEIAENGFSDEPLLEALVAENALKIAIENLRLDEVNTLLATGVRYERAYYWIQFPVPADIPDALRRAVALVEYLVRQNLSFPAHSERLYRLFELASSYPSLLIIRKILEAKRGAVRDIMDPYDFDPRAALVMAYEFYQRTHPRCAFPIDLARILALDEGAVIDALGTDGYDTVYTMALFAGDKELVAFCETQHASLNYLVPYDEPADSVFRLNAEATIPRVEYELSLGNYDRTRLLIKAGAFLWALDTEGSLFKDYWWKVFQKMVDKLIAVISDRSQPVSIFLTRLEEEVHGMIQFFKIAQSKKTKGGSFTTLFLLFQDNLTSLNVQYYKDRKANKEYRPIIELGMWLKLVFGEDYAPGEVLLWNKLREGIADGPAAGGAGAL